MKVAFFGLPLAACLLCHDGHEIVFVLAGEIDVQCSSGAGHRFQQGDILWFTGLSVRSLRNGGSVPVRLLAIWRIAHR